MCSHARVLRGRTDGRATVRRGRHGRQAASADRLRAGIEGLGGNGQAKIAMSRQGRGLRGRTDGRVGTCNPAEERRDGLFFLINNSLYGNDIFRCHGLYLPTVFKLLQRNWQWA